MQVSIKYQPSYSLGIWKLEQGEAVVAEAGAMVSMNTNLKMDTKMRGGIMKALGRSFFGGESLFQNTFTAENGSGELTVAPPVPGDLTVVELNGNSLYLQSGAYVACSDKVTIDTKWGGAKSFFGAGKGLFMLKCSGSGPIMFSSFGAQHLVEIPNGEKYIIDTGHVAAFSEELGESGRFKITKVGGLKGLFLSGEGLVAEFTGPGKVWIQTRSFGAFVGAIAPYLSRS